MASSLDTVGRLTDVVDDVETVFNIIKALMVLTEQSQDLYQSQVTNHKLIVGIPKEFFVGGLDKEIEKNIHEVKLIFEKSENIEFVDVSLPSTKYGISVYYIIQPAEVSSNLGRFDGIRYGSTRKILEEAKRRNNAWKLCTVSWIL